MNCFLSFIDHFKFFFFHSAHIEYIRMNPWHNIYHIQPQQKMYVIEIDCSSQMIFFVRVDKKGLF